MSIRDMPAPAPGQHEVSIDVQFAGVGFVDTLFRDGTFPLPVPFIPGLEVGGTIRAVGVKVNTIAPGDRVVALLNDFGRAPGAGGYAEVALARADLVTVVPDSLSLAAASGAVVNGTTAQLGLEAAKLQRADHVLVLGAGGGVGEAAVRLAAAAGAKRIIAVTGSAHAQRTLRAAGASDVIQRAQLSHRTIPALATGFDVVVDPVGGALREVAMRLLRPFGRLVLLGTASREDVALPSDDIWHRTLTVTGLSLGGVAHLVPDRVRSAMAYAVKVLAGADGIKPVVMALDQVVAAHSALAEGRAPAKMVLSLS